MKLKNLYCFYIFYLFNSFSCILIFPFKTVSQNNNNINSDSKEYNYSHFFNDYYNQLIYAKINIGNPPQEVKTLITYNDCNFKIGKARKCIYNSEYLSHYNRNYSNDFNYTDYYPYHISEFEGNRGHSAEETIYVYTDLNLKNYSNFTNIGFYLGSDTNDSLCGIIGLRILNYATYCLKSNNIIKSFKLRNIINNYQWILNYTSKDEGLFILGANLTELIPQFSDENLYWTYSIMGGSMFPWMIMISKIECGENNMTITTNEVRAEINNDYSLSIGNSAYNSYIDNNFFSEYIKLNICYKNIVSNEDNFKYVIYECDKKGFGKDNITKFPNISFIMRNFEKKFVFEGRDLFTETKYKFFFNIIFSNSWRESWVLGKVFLKKYITLFNLDSKMIQIYNKINKEENESNGKDEEGKKEKKEGNDNSSENYILYIILLNLFIVCIFSILFYFIGKHFNKRKKKANELVDEYDYTTSEVNKTINNFNSLN